MIARSHRSTTSSCLTQCTHTQTRPFHTGECTANPNYMLYQCKKSCKTCSLDARKLRVLADYRIRLHAVGGDERLLETPYGITQRTQGLDPEKVREIETNMAHYIQNVVQKEKKYKDVKHKCKNTQPDCIRLKIAGQCSGLIPRKCAPACETCEHLDFKHRCPIDETIPQSLKPGDLNRLFERILSDEHYQQYKPKVLSMPATNAVTNTSIAADDGRIIPDGPWLVVFEQFLTHDECQHVRDLGHVQGYKASADVGPQDLEGKITSKYSEGRTSTNSWCTDTCATDAIVKGVTQRMVNVTGIPEENQEYLQLLRYEPGQHYGRHHDYADYHLDRQHGPRVLTFFLYLNTVEQGGGTDFPVLNMTVQPKMGRAVLWPSVLDSDPNARDGRTDHAALSVLEGIKYGANAWIHQNDFKVPYSRGCV